MERHVTLNRRALAFGLALTPLAAPAMAQGALTPADQALVNRHGLGNGGGPEPPFAFGFVGACWDLLKSSGVPRRARGASVGRSGSQRTRGAAQAPAEASRYLGGRAMQVDQS